MWLVLPARCPVLEPLSMSGLVYRGLSNTRLPPPGGPRLLLYLVLLCSFPQLFRFVYLFTKKGLLQSLESGLLPDFGCIDDALYFIIFLCIRVLGRWGLGGVRRSLVWA